LGAKVFRQPNLTIITTTGLGIINMNYCKMFLLWVLLATAFSTSALETISIDMDRQISYPYYGKGFKRVAVGNPEVADITVIDERQVLITPKKVGATSLMFWRSDKAGARPDRQVKLLVTASESLKRQAVDKNDDLEVSEVGNKLKLSGQSASLEGHNQARQSLDEKSAATVDASRLGFDSQVQIDIKIVEISRIRLQNAGLFLGKSGANATYALSSPGNLMGVQSAGSGAILLLSKGFFPHAQAFNFIYGNASEGILGVISVLENNGFAYTLAEPSLVAMSGQSANFLAGGEFPVPIPQGGSQSGAITITYKEFGIRLSLTPDRPGPEPYRPEKVAPEVSELDTTAGIQSGGAAVPALRVRRTDTSISLGDGESFVISGLVSQNTLGSVDKLPWLGDLPILGAFFRSTHIDRSDKELIMVVTPHLVQALAKGASLPPMPGERFRQYDPNFFQVFFQETGKFRSKSPCPIRIFEITT
jgi:pilus assembly protein CpaC